MNGGRALALGPWRCGLFVWWSTLDQRMAIWTGLLSLVLFFYAGRVHISFPLQLFGGQISGSAVKLHLLFHLPKQQWLNRGDQRQRPERGRLLPYQEAMAVFLTTVYVSMLLLGG